jgi:hypothetical protein
MLDIKNMIEEYIRHTKNHGDATLNGDSKAANNSYEKIIDNIKLIHDVDPEGEVFMGLLKHENESVRLWSSTHALFMSEAEALEALIKISQGSSIFSFGASITVDEWKKGSLTSPFSNKGGTH